MDTQDSIAKLEQVLRDEHRIKRDVDYAMMHKAGKTHIICDAIWADEIQSVAMAIPLWVEVTQVVRYPQMAYDPATDPIPMSGQSMGKSKGAEVILGSSSHRSTSDKPNFDVIEKANKGAYLGNCNRTACDRDHATWYNHSTHKYYCEPCAKFINKENMDDAMKMYGHALCMERSDEPKEP